MKFAIRDVLWTTALVAVALAWWIDRARRQDPVTPAAPGRYQIFMSEGDTMLLDTATGELWSRPKSHTSFYRSDSPWIKSK